VKWRSTSRILFNHKIPIKLKGELYKTAIHPAMIYSTEFWNVNMQHIHEMIVAKMRMLRCI